MLSKEKSKQLITERIYENIEESTEFTAEQVEEFSHGIVDTLYDLIEGVSISFNNINKIQKYCDNQISYNDFSNVLESKYHDDTYRSEIWLEFRKNPISFMTSRGELELFDYIMNEIEATNYKG